MLAASSDDSPLSGIDEPEIDNSEKESRTWSFRACVRLKDGQTFSDLLDARKPQLETYLPSKSVISWACASTARDQVHSRDLNGVYLEGFVHASTLIRLGSLKRVLPAKMVTEAGEIMEAAFEAVMPGPGKDYMGHPTIKRYLQETPLDPLDTDKRMRVDYRGSSASDLEIIMAIHGLAAVR
jgi:hypothetical protein